MMRCAPPEQVLVYCLRTLLALAHPLMPFVTERLWGVLPARQGAQRRPLITAAWPSHAGAIDEAAIAQYEVRAHKPWRHTLLGHGASAAVPVPWSQCVVMAQFWTCSS